MAVIPTGSASLRGVGPQAPAPREFNIDVQSLGRAAVVPAMVGDTLDVYGERRRERQIDEQTFDNRLAKAKEIAKAEAERIGKEEGIKTMKVEGEFARVPAEQELLGLLADENLTDYEQNRGQRQLATQAASDKLRTEIAQSDLELQDLTGNRAKILGTQTMARQNAMDTQALGATNLRNQIRAAEGITESHIYDTPEGRFKVTGVYDATGKFQQTGNEQILTPAQVEAEQQKIETARLTAQSYAASIAANAARSGMKVTSRIQELKDGDENPVGFLAISIDANGKVVGTTRIDQDGKITEISTKEAVETAKTLGPNAQKITDQFKRPTSAGGEAADAAAAGVNFTRNIPTQAGQQEAAPQVEQRGAIFTPTGINVGGYIRGKVYIHPMLGRVIYTGGDPWNPGSFRAMEFEDTIQTPQMALGAGQ